MVGLVGDHRLRRGHRVAQARFDHAVPSTFGGSHEHGQEDADQYGNDGDHHHQLDEREACVVESRSASIERLAFDPS
jgi:hypothetical protein